MGSSSYENNNFFEGGKVSCPQIHGRFVFQSAFLRNRYASVECFQIEIHVLLKNLTGFQRKLLENFIRDMSATERN